MSVQATMQERVLELIQEEKRPPTWRWCATARYDDLVAGLWEWQADISEEATLLTRELIHIEQEALERWPRRNAVVAADDALTCFGFEPKPGMVSESLSLIRSHDENSY